MSCCSSNCSHSLPSSFPYRPRPKKAFVLLNCTIDGLFILKRELEHNVDTVRILTSFMHFHMQSFMLLSFFNQGNQCFPLSDQQLTNLHLQYSTHSNNIQKTWAMKFQPPQVFPEKATVIPLCYVTRGMMIMEAAAATRDRTIMLDANDRLFCSAPDCGDVCCRCSCRSCSSRRLLLCRVRPSASDGGPWN